MTEAETMAELHNWRHHAEARLTALREAEAEARECKAQLAEAREALCAIVEHLGHFRDNVALQCHPWQEPGAAAVYRLLLEDCNVLIAKATAAL